MVLRDQSRIRRGLVAKKLLQKCRCLPVLVVLLDINRMIGDLAAALAKIQCQVDGDSKYPGVKGAVAGKPVDILYYFDKRVLRKFRGVVGVAAHSVNNVVNTILIPENQPFGSLRIAFAASLNQYGIVNSDARCFVHAASPLLDFG